MNGSNVVGCPHAQSVSSSSIMARLREETKDAHAHAESRPLEASMFGGTLPRALYVEFLAQRRLLHHALETRVVELTRRERRLAGLLPDELLQTRRLDQDLQHFAVEPQAIRANTAVRAALGEIQRLADTTPIALLGLYYVLEGSKNGARVLSRIVEKAYGLTGGNGIRYLDPHGEFQRRYWTEFKERMDALPLDTSEQNAVVDAARLAFKLISDIDDAIWATRAA